MVDVSRFELPGIEVQHFAVLELFRVKIPLPLLIRVSRSAHTKLAFARNGEPPLFWHLITAAAQGKGTAVNDQDVFFARGGMRLLNASIASSILCRPFPNSPQRSPFSFFRPKTVFLSKVSL